MSQSSPPPVSASGLCTKSTHCVYTIDGRLVCRDVNDTIVAAKKPKQHETTRSDDTPTTPRGVVEAMTDARTDGESTPNASDVEPKPAWSSRMADMSMRLRDVRKKPAAEK